ncbi:MAG: hypothetical protein FJ276_13520, partial [Planctomycetes bacterium]|nr:hypothetical protein [Planctomycetota bacterium]
METAHLHVPGPVRVPGRKRVSRMGCAGHLSTVPHGGRSAARCAGRLGDLTRSAALAIPARGPGRTDSPGKTALNTDNSSLKSRWMAIAKQLVRVSILAVVGWCIWRTVVHAQDEMSGQFSLADLRPGWIVLAGVLYLAGLFPCWVFWHRTLWAMGQRPRWRDTLPAFWIGHLGKYVPGKAMVVVLRTGLVSGERVSKTVAATSVFVETLTMMAVGACLSATILLLASSHWSLMLLAFGLMVLSGAPTIPPVFRRIVRALQVHRANPEIEPAVRGLDYRLMAMGWLSIGGGWFLLGLSLW